MPSLREQRAFGRRGGKRRRRKKKRKEPALQLSPFEERRATVNIPIKYGESSNFNGNFRYIFQTFVAW